jgi:hypothetical protein
VHCDVALTFTIAGLQVTESEVIAGGVNCTVIAAVPDFVGSCVLVAVTVTVPAEPGAVKSPLALMLPPFADQVTTEL